MHRSQKMSPPAIRALAALCLVVFTTGEDCQVSPASRTLLKWDLKRGSSTTSARDVRIEFVEETLAEIEAIGTPISVVSILGPYRSGKSFTLNQLLPTDAKPDGANPFHVGHTVQPETEEVSVLIVPPCASPIEGVSLLVLDSPGLFAPNRAQIFDAQLVAALNLVSNVVVYNSLGVIDRSSIEKLSLAVEAARAMAYLGDDADAADKSLSRPHLCFALQNFHLQLKDLDGNELAPKQWIEDMLATIDIAHNSTSNFVEQFHSFFESLDVFPLPYPTHSLDDADHLDTLPPSAFTDKYTTRMEDMRRLVYTLAGQPKLIGALPMTGRIAANLIRSWTESMNIPLGASTSFKNSAAILLDHLTAKEVGSAFEEYIVAMRAIKFPISEAELRQLHGDALSAALVHDDVPAFTARVKEMAQEKFAVFLGMNEQAMRQVLDEKMAAAKSEIKNVLGSLDFPLTQEQLNEQSTESFGVWMKAVAEIRTVSPTAVASFDNDLQHWLDNEFDNMKQPNADATLNALQDYLDDVRTALSADLARVDLPVRASLLEDAANDVTANWEDSNSDLLGIDDSVRGLIKQRLASIVQKGLEPILENNMIAAKDVFSTALENIKADFIPQLDAVALPTSKTTLDSMFTTLSNAWQADTADVRSKVPEPASEYDTEFSTWVDSIRGTKEAASLNEVNRLLQGSVETIAAETGTALEALEQPATQSAVDGVANTANARWDTTTQVWNQWSGAVAAAKEALALRIDDMMAKYGAVNSKRLGAVLATRLSRFAQGVEGRAMELGMMASQEDFDAMRTGAVQEWDASVEELKAVDANTVEAFRSQAVNRLGGTVTGAQDALYTQLIKTSGFFFAGFVCIGTLAILLYKGKRKKAPHRKSPKLAV